MSLIGGNLRQYISKKGKNYLNLKLKIYLNLRDYIPLTNNLSVIKEKVGIEPTIDLQALAQVGKLYRDFSKRTKLPT